MALFPAMPMHIPINPTSRSDPNLPPIPIETESPLGVCIPLGRCLIRCPGTADIRMKQITYVAIIMKYDYA